MLITLIWPSRSIVRFMIYHPKIRKLANTVSHIGVSVVLMCFITSVFSLLPLLTGDFITFFKLLISSFVILILVSLYLIRIGLTVVSKPEDIPSVFTYLVISEEDELERYIREKFSIYNKLSHDPDLQREILLTLFETFYKYLYPLRYNKSLISITDLYKIVDHVYESFQPKIKESFEKLENLRSCALRKALMDS